MCDTESTEYDHQNQAKDNKPKDKAATVELPKPNMYHVDSVLRYKAKATDYES